MAPDSHAAVNVQGSVAPGFEPVKSAFLENFDESLPCPEVGASFCACLNGEIVVDLWGGRRDVATGALWEKTTIANVFSTSKGLSAACIALLNDRGLLQYDLPVAHYWPEFGQHGKGEITVATALSHQGGLSGVRTPLTPTDLYDWRKMVSVIEQAVPLWTPGAFAGYHAITWGFIAGELVRRISGKTIGQLLQTELAAPLEADVHIGVTRAALARIANMIPPRNPVQSMAEPSEILELTLGNPLIEAKTANESEWRAAEIPAANGHANGRGVSLIYGMLASPGSFNTALSAEAVERATVAMFEGRDHNLGIETRWGAAGFFLNNPLNWYGPNKQAFGHSGWGGSTGFADPVCGLGVGYVPNQMDTELNGDARSTRLISALYDCL